MKILYNLHQVASSCAAYKSAQARLAAHNRSIMLGVFCLFAALGLLLVAADEDALKLCLPKMGCLRGELKDGHLTEDYEAFMGIPFAKPPVGELRLKNPVPITEPWEDVFDAILLMPPCLQKSLLMKDPYVFGIEDCLYLNVYRPHKRSADKLPVLFYIHGGGYFSGSPNMLEADYLMATGEVILVTCAYRLGPFGFLSTGDESMPGNFGLKDQHLALQWVHDNIAAFGGDPDLVTISGHSAGGASVHQHMLSESSRGLFQRAIAFSGTALTPFGEQVKDPLAQARRIASYCGIADADTLSPADLSEAIRKLDADMLVNAIDTLHAWYRLPSFYYRPVIEQPEWQGAFLTSCTTGAQLSGKFTQVPFLLSTVPGVGEGSVLLLSTIEDEALRADFNSDFDRHLSGIMQLPEAEASEILNELLAAYTNGVHEFNNDTMTGMLALFGDYLFQYGFRKTLESHVKHADAAQSPLYMLYFNYRGYYSYSNVILGGTKRDIGVVHLDDTIYMFYIPFLFPEGMGTDTPCAKVKHRMVQLLVDFMKFGELRSSSAEIGACTADQLSAAGENDICDYLNIENGGDSFQESASKRFEVKAKDVWQKIFGF